NPPDYKGALKEFNEVLKHGKSVGALLNIGACYEGLGDREQNMSYYRKALDAYSVAEETAATTKDDRRPDALAAQSKLRDGHPWIRLRVRPEVIDLEGLSITVDEIVVPRDEYNGEVFRPRTGRHTVQIMARDRDPATLTANDRETVDVKLELL